LGEEAKKRGKRPDWNSRPCLKKKDRVAARGGSGPNKENNHKETGESCKKKYRSELFTGDPRNGELIAASTAPTEVVFCGWEATRWGKGKHCVWVK